MKRRLAFILLLLAFNTCFSLAPPLEREITLTFSNEPIKSALIKIQEQTGLVFSYRPSIIESVTPVTLQLRQKTVREALALMLPHNILFKQKSNYIILKERPVEKNPKKAELSGYVIDRTTEKKVPNVTIYDKTTLKSVTTDEYGFYSITVPNDNQCLKVNKENYRDTCVPLGQNNNITNISIDQVSDATRARDSAAWRTKIRDFSRSTNDLFRKFKGYVTTRNVKDTFNRKVQVSLLPFLGTNGLLSGNVNNDYSFNILGGYGQGSNIVEIGSFFNVDKERVTGLQVGGFFNIVGDSVKGIQIAGFLNVTGRSMTGFQGAGFVNLNFGTLSGIQTAGFVNVNARISNGISMAGILNVNRYSVEGVELAGMANINGDTLEGVAMSALTNLSWYSKRSLELTGLFNYARTGDGNIQVSAFSNSTPRGSTNIQIAPFYNRAHKLTGFQLGLVNVVDSASGVPLGFFSFVKKGLHQVEISADETFHGNVAIRTGVNAFHNIFTFGRSTRPGSPMWSIGYGIGTSFKIGKKLRSDISLTANHVSVGEFYNATSELYRLYLGFEYRLFKKFSVAAGPTFNLYWSDALLPDYATTYNKIAPYYSYNKELANYFNLKSWYGVRVALRFF